MRGLLEREEDGKGHREMGLDCGGMKMYRDGLARHEMADYESTQ